ncbi:MAG: hypothetical protein IT288_17615 [Bdellovibrionales bacterium]|nr:hypothetical protein [Bdellovibrionales bacterium]
MNLPDDLLSFFNSNASATPAFVLSESAIKRRASEFVLLKERLGISKLLYSVKACPLKRVIQTIHPYVDGFSVSSISEIELVRGSVGDDCFAHYVSPLINDDVLNEIQRGPFKITFNSLEQVLRFGSQIPSGGLIRTQTQRSALRKNFLRPKSAVSKLGAMASDIVARESALLSCHISGFHIHNAHLSTTMRPHINNLSFACTLRDQLKMLSIKEINLGGGQILGTLGETEKQTLKVEIKKSNLDITIEPGAGMVWNSGWLISRVVDTFTKCGKRIAILDTSVNHLPYVLDFGITPQVYGTVPKGDPIVLGGATCLERDILGEYRFPEPLKIGELVLFKNVGAYSLARANRFNGIRLPRIFWLGNSLDEYVETVYQTQLT